MLKRLWVGLRNAKTFRRCEEPLGIDTESIEIGQKFFRMLDEEHLLSNFSTASFNRCCVIPVKRLTIIHVMYICIQLTYILKELRKGLCATGLLA